MEVNKEDAFVIFRLPNTDIVYQINGLVVELDLNNNRYENAFVIAPFNSHNSAFAIPYSNLQQFDGVFPEPKFELPNKFENLGQKHFETIVGQAIEMMQSNLFQKVVLANSKTIVNEKIEIEKVFTLIEKAYPSAFVYYLSTPQTGTWLGASPEPLVVGSNQLYKTVAMAGTLKADTTNSWTEKEKIEQNWVEIYLEKLLLKFQFKYKKSDPFTYKSGNLIHLRTEFSFDCEDKKELSKFLLDINPTPAVAGLPKKKTLQFIRETESLERTFYAGFLGLYSKNEIQLFVNLRCLTIQSSKLTLFAGAGITKDSKPELEWIETQNKMKALENYLS